MHSSTPERVRARARPVRATSARRRTHAIFLLAGIAGFVVVVWRTGPSRLVAEVRGAGWVLVPVVLIYALVYFAGSEAWRLTMHERPPRVSSARAFAITVWAVALNYVTPLMSVGGEPFKIAAAAPVLGLRESASSVLGARLIHLEAHLLFFLTGVAVAAVLLPRDAVGSVALVTVGAALALITALVVLAHRSAGIDRLLGLLLRLPVGPRLGGWLRSKRAAAAEVDAQIVAFTRDTPRRYLLAIGFEYAARCIGVVELMLIANAVGAPVGYATAFLIGSFLSLAVNVFFFVPFALGAREAGLYAIFAILGLSPALGVAASVVGRLREFIWIGIGLGLGAASGSMHRGGEQQRPEGRED
jgi:hypothetical protein